jgi:hypothetical protein
MDVALFVERNDTIGADLPLASRVAAVTVDEIAEVALLAETRINGAVATTFDFTIVVAAVAVAAAVVARFTGRRVMFAVRAKVEATIVVAECAFAFVVAALNNTVRKSVIHDTVAAHRDRAVRTTSARAAGVSTSK